MLSLLNYTLQAKNYQYRKSHKFIFGIWYGWRRLLFIPYFAVYFREVSLQKPLVFTFKHDIITTNRHRKGECIMKQQEVFGNALWVSAENSTNAKFFLLRGRFSLHNAKKVMLRVLGLGIFHCYINGTRVSDDLFLPLNSDFEARENFPPEEKISGHRIYVPEYDITSYIKNGENVIAIHFGGGWYTYDAEKKFGDAKAIWRIWGEGADGGFEYGSSRNDKISPSFVKEYHFTAWETHDYLALSEDALTQTFDDSSWDCASHAPQLDTEYLFSDCPADGVCETLAVQQIVKTSDCTVYDCGKNTTGYPILNLKGKPGDKVRVLFSEEVLPSGALHPDFCHGQEWNICCDGKQRQVHPLFLWFGFRYFAVYGNAEVISVETVHTKVDVTASFCSDNDLLNWLHDTFINTQLTNMHSGIPSDCPHLERRGYTGDGQLVCRTAMHMMDAERFYRKWIKDIADCQDVLTGHIQYTAPYTHSGGGPGGWGCAIVEVPYQFYLHYGDISVLKDCYPHMLRYFDYLESHSSGNLVISDKEGEWCLGDWCTPSAIILPAPFVNNYFYIKSLYRCIEIAELIGKEADIPLFQARIEARKDAIVHAYYNKWDGNFLGCRQGANAFALDIGLGDERTYPNLVKYYKDNCGFDTGIFGTELVTRTLFERGDGQLACDLLLSESAHSFAMMRQAGATTLWEYFPGSLRDRSHNHPMFGAVVGCFYDYLLGIRADRNDLTIAPVIVEGIDRLNGSRTLPAGCVSVSYEKHDGRIFFEIRIPQDAKAVFSYEGTNHPLNSGINKFEF